MQLTNKINLILIALLCSTSLLAQQRTFRFEADPIMLQSIDSSTLHLQSKLYKKPTNGDLNIYGFDENDVPLYSDSAYIYRLAAMESDIPMEYNEFVKRYIDLYTIKRRKLTSKMLSLSTYYFPIFEEALDREKMPQELKYLAVIESALNPNAVSPVGAAGMWQFMPATGRMYGLKAGSQYDERRDVIKATDAAIKYLQNSYRIYGDWLLVIASYNCGPGNVNKAIKRAGGVYNFWAIQKYLPGETRGYVPAFIAAAYAMTYASEHNIYPAEDFNINLHNDTVYVDNRYNLKQLASQLSMSIEEIKQLNPSLRNGNIPFMQDKIALTLPYNKAMLLTSLISNPDFKQQADFELVERKTPATEKTVAKKYHTVRRGEALGKIAKKYQVSVQELKDWNNLSGNKLPAGKKLIVRTKRG